MDTNQKEELIRIENLKVYFKINKNFFKKQYLKAVDNVSFNVNKGEIFCLVGESGCGKTTLGRTILNLYNPTSGNIYFHNKIINYKNKKLLKNFRQKTQMIFQDPYSSLDPRMTVENLIAEPLDIYKKYKNKNERRQKVIELMKLTSLSLEYIDRYIHEMSGGQKQRIGIARSLALDPELIVCDEPISALDVSIQAQIINVFLELKEKMNLTYIFITHNLLVVKHIANRIAVMYLGHIVELANADELFNHPMHPYTLLLLNSIPALDNEKNSNNISFENNNMANPLDNVCGCLFRNRCKKAQLQCEQSSPDLKEFKNGHFVACFYPEDCNK